MPVSPSRLTLARALRGQTLAELGRQTGLSPQTINRWEKGHQEPTPEYLGRLAGALRLPVEFFTQPEIEPVPVDAVSFRAVTKTPAFRRDAVLAAGGIAREIATWISERFRLPAADVPSLNLPPDASFHDVETIALRVRGQWDLDQRPIPNMVHLLEARGVRVFSLVQEVRDVDAFSFYMENEPFVFIDTGKTAERQRFDAAHELGHLVMHQGPERVQSREAERQADRFAAAFLMPRADVLACNLRNAGPDQLIDASRRWRVSAMALAHRLGELGLLTEWGYRSACVELAKRGYRRSEPGSHLVPESSQILEKVFAHLRANGSGVKAIIESTKLTSEEFNRHVFGLAKTVSLGGSDGLVVTARPNRSHLQLVDG
ncbi:ImmA/IrrE family metallo-endopeptidase [Amycolatopsis sp. QT-25]|uniref:helix-turn-helix domain-containing protein n=1 Tax=Amycolatopsis sp. QT-25 TaxID=3034022 RepID=UPI0023EC2544|nr:ImmA/IrrE family metallo-endopeptidase [Amycolatopsis sp. QT-25]WET81098.1 ImmA/IrrE family metallo-endopeptidase [Amycolatopsis sp. QT-25]